MPEQPDGARPSRERVLAAVERRLPRARALAAWMAAHPEPSLEERETSARYRDWLAEEGFRLEPGPPQLPTAFRAVREGPGEGAGREARPADGAGPPPSAALVAEMDALPGIGHACGHNVSGPASLAAAAALAEVFAPEALRVLVVGSPAEEIGVGKRRLVAAGCFDDVDVALMAHASDMRRAHRLFLGNQKLDLTFHGRAAHAAAYPERGVNALDGVIQLFVALGLLRQQLPDGVRVHGVVREGGEAPNVIPERARAEVWVRALGEAELEDAAARVRACAEGAARASGTRLEVRALETSSPSLWPVPPLADCYRRQLASLGLEETPHPPDRAIGSSDITHVSRVVPAIHPNFPIAPEGRALELHTRAFAEAAAGEGGAAGLAEAARALALTVAEWAGDAALRDAVAAAGPPAELAERHRRALRAAHGS